jgi:simple sugar transport system ATP-binding protein
MSIVTQPRPSTAASPAPNGTHPVIAPPHIEAIRLTKHFAAVKALTDVSLTLPPGMSRALLGENGAGKSTLVKCMMGTYRADSGSVKVGENSMELRNPRQAHAMGIGMVYQHFTLVENMSVVENMVMARGHLPSIIHWKDEAEQLRAFMDHMPFRVDPTALVRNLSAGEKQKVEILKQLYLDRKVIILDEPTSVLTPQEADEVLSMVRKMCADGKLSVLMITHKFREVMAFCDAVTVLRHGKLVGEGKVGELSPKEMAEMMMGNAVIPEPAARAPVPESALKEPRLIIDSLTADNEMNVPTLRGLSLKVKAHEIVGIAGVSGNGQRELVRILAGQRPAKGGKVVAHGDAYRGGREEIRKHHFHVLPEMPLQNACVPSMTTGENLAFRAFDKPPFTWVKWLLNRTAVKSRAEDLIKRYRVRPASHRIRIGNLSGGNVQRAVLARELSGEVDLLVAANPCFGLDFKAVAEIRSQIMEARNRGAGVLLVSEDLDEILELADRILVISGGKIVYETTSAEADRQVIGKYMAGH